MRLEQARQHVKVQSRRIEVQHAPLDIYEFPVFPEALDEIL